jgi:hypothetical protein
MNEVPASRKTGLKLPQNFSRQSSEHQFDLGEDEGRGRGASQELTPRIGSCAIIQFKKLPLCEVAHTPPEIRNLYAGWLPAAAAWSVPPEGAVPRTNLWSHSVPRVELDQRSREASLRLEHIERLFKPLVRVRPPQFLAAYLCS